MKISTYRILYLIAQILFVFLTGYFVFDLLYNGLQAQGKIDFTINLIAFFVLGGLAIFQAYWISASFKKGTQILSFLCINKDKSRNKAIFNISLICLIVSVIIVLWFLFNLINFNSIKIGTLNIYDFKLIIAIFSHLFINSSFVFLYTCCMAYEDLSNFKN